PRRSARKAGAKLLLLRSRPAPTHRAPCWCAPTKAGWKSDARIMAWLMGVAHAWREDARMSTIPPMSSPGNRALRKGRYSEPGRIYHLTTTTQNRSAIFADHRAAWAACRRFEDRRLLGDARMLAWVLMP